MTGLTKPGLLTCLIGIAIAINACQRIPKTVTIRTSQGLTLIDSTSALNVSNLHENLPVGYYPIYYIGNQNDTVFISKKRIPEYEESKEDTIRSLTDLYQAPDSTNTRIVVDTMLTVPFATHYVDETGKESPDSTIYYKSVAVLIYNLVDKPLYVATFTELRHTVRQTKDNHGNWIDIETPISYFCGTGSQPKLIHKGQILVAKALLHNGDLKKECRLKFQYKNNVVYSNTYIDYVDNDQLKKPAESFWN